MLEIVKGKERRMVKMCIIMCYNVYKKLKHFPHTFPSLTNFSQYQSLSGTADPSKMPDLFTNFGYSLQRIILYTIFTSYCISYLLKM